MFGSTLLLALREIRRHILRSILTTLGMLLQLPQLLAQRLQASRQLGRLACK